MFGYTVPIGALTIFVRGELEIVYHTKSVKRSSQAILCPARLSWAKLPPLANPRVSQKLLHILGTP